MATRKAIIHSEEAKGVQEVEVLEYRGIEDVVVMTPTGVKCLAVDNPFTGLLHCDDIYRKVG